MSRLQAKVKSAIAKIESQNKSGRFDNNLSHLKDPRTKFVLRRRLHYPIRRMHGVLGTNTIAVRRDFNNFSESSFVGHLLHESQHLEQARRHPPFHKEYLWSKRKRFYYELDALRENIFWYAETGFLAHMWSMGMFPFARDKAGTEEFTIGVNYWVEEVTDHMGKNYWLGNFYDQDMKHVAQRRLYQYIRQALDKGEGNGKLLQQTPTN